MSIVDIYNSPGGYGVIYADPPWSYRQKGRGAAANHYQTMAAEEIKALPVERLAGKDCVLFMWATFPNLQQALDTIRAWGFEYKTLGFCWIKQNKRGGGILGAGELHEAKPGGVPAGDTRTPESEKPQRTQRDTIADRTAQPEAGRSAKSYCAAFGRSEKAGAFRTHDFQRVGQLGKRGARE